MYIRYGYDSYSYIMVVNRMLTRNEFINRCGAKDGFAAKLFGHLYDCIFVEAMDVEHLYEQYYKAEYDSYSEFLLKRYGMTNFMHNEFMKLLKSDSDLYVIEFSSLNYGDSSMEDFLFSEKCRDRIYKILVMKD